MLYGLCRHLSEKCVCGSSEIYYGWSSETKTQPYWQLCRQNKASSLDYPPFRFPWLGHSHYCCYNTALSVLHSSVMQNTETQGLEKSETSHVKCISAIYNIAKLFVLLNDCCQYCTGQVRSQVSIKKERKMQQEVSNRVLQQDRDFCSDT